MNEWNGTHAGRLGLDGAGHSRANLLIEWACQRHYASKRAMTLEASRGVAYAVKWPDIGEGSKEGMLRSDQKREDGRKEEAWNPFNMR